MLYHINGRNKIFLRHSLYFNLKHINRFKEQAYEAYEFERLVSKIEYLEKEKNNFQQKFEKASSELLVMKDVHNK